MRGRQGCHQVGHKSRNKWGGDTEQNEPRKQRAAAAERSAESPRLAEALTSHSSAATMPCPYLVSPPTRPPVVAVLPPAAALLLPSSPLCTSAHSSPVSTRQLWWLAGQTLQKKRGWYALQKASQATTPYTHLNCGCTAASSSASAMPLAAALRSAVSAAEVCRTTDANVTDAPRTAHATVGGGGGGKSHLGAAQRRFKAAIPGTSASARASWPTTRRSSAGTTVPRDAINATTMAAAHAAACGDT